MNALAGATRRTLDGLPETLAAADVDALVLDEVLWCVGLVPMHPGMPYVHVSNALTFDFSGNTPLCSYLWPHETTTEALVRNQEGLRQFAHIAESYRSVGRDYAEQVGLDIDWADSFATLKYVVIGRCLKLRCARVKSDGRNQDKQSPKWSHGGQ